MIVLTCPRCNRPQEADIDSRPAESFCADCDYPLFFAPPGAVVVAPAPPPEPTPTPVPAVPAVAEPEVQPEPTNGLHTVCPHCGAENPPFTVVCRQCAKPVDAEDWPAPEPTVALVAEPRTASVALALSVLALLVAFAALVAALA